MAQKQVQQVDILVTQASVDAAKRLTDQFAVQKGMVDALLNSLKLVDTQLKALKSAQIAKTPKYAQGAGAAQETQVQKTAISADQKRIQAYKDLLKLDQERSAFLMSQSRMLDEEAKRVKKINDLEALALNLRAAQFRAKEAQLQQNTKEQRAAERLVDKFQKRIDQINAEARAKEAALKREKDALAAMDRMAAQIDTGRSQREKAREREGLAIMRRMQQEIDTGLKERERKERQISDAAKRALEERIRLQQKANALDEKRMMQPFTDRVNAQRSREMSELRLFGDGGASLLRIQASLMANYALVNQVTSAFTNAVSASYEFDRSLRDLQAIVKITDGGMQSLKSTIIQASDASKFTANEVTQAAIILGQAGFSNAQIRESVSAVSQLATATGTELTRAVDVATSVIGVFNLEASRMQTVANTLTQAVNSSKLDIEKLTLGLQYAGNTAYDAGVSFEELTAGLGAMANAGIRSGSTLGTGMRQILVSLEKPSETFERNLHKLGLTTYDVDLKTKGLYGVMKTLREAGFSAGDAIESFEVRSAAAFIALSNNLPLMESMQQSFYGSVAASQAQETQMRSLAGQSERLNGVLSSLAYEAFEPMLYLLRDAAQSTGDFLVTLRESGDSLRMFGTIMAATVGSAALYATVNRLFGLFGLLPSQIMMTQAATVQLGASMAKNLAFGTVATSGNLLVASLQNLMITFKSLPTLFAVASTASGTFTASLATARVGIAALGSAIAAWLPLLAAVGFGLYTAIQAFSSYESEQERANNAVDMWRTKLDNSRGAVESYRAKIKEVEDRIQSLSNRSKELNRNQDMLKSEIAQVRSQFAGMDSAIDGTESSVESLITKLQALWTQLQQQYILKIGVQISNLGGLMTALNLQGMDIGNRMSAAQFTGQSQDTELEKAYAEVVRTRGTAEFADARAKFDTLIAARQTELENRDYMNLPAPNQPDSYQDPLATPSSASDPRVDRRNFLQESLRRATDLSSLVNEMGTLEANKLDVQSQMSQAELEQMDANARTTMRPVEDQRRTIEGQIREGLTTIEKVYADDPIKRFQATEALARQYLPMIEGVEAQIQRRNGVDLTETVASEQLGKWNELKGMLTGAADEAFTGYDKEQNSIEDSQARTSNVVYQGVLERARRSNTTAEAGKNYSDAERQAQMLLDQELAAIDTGLRKDSSGNFIETTESRAARRNAQDMFDERMRDIERERQNTIEGIESGTGGQTAISRANFDRQIDDLRTSDTNIQNKFENGELRRADAATGMATNIETAQSMLTALTAERQRLEAKGALTAEERAQFRYLAGAENTLRDYIRSRGSEINSFLNEPEGGADTAANRAFNTSMSSLQDRVEQTRIAARLKEIDEKAAKERYAAIQADAQTQLTSVQARIKPIQAKVDAKMPLTPAEERAYSQGVSEEKRLKSFMADNLSNVEGASGGSGGSGGGKADSGAGRDFNLLMDELKSGMSDTQQDLKYNDIAPAEGLAKMDEILANAKEVHEVSRQQMAVMKEGSAEYNRLKGEERTLLGFIREEEANIRKEKERQGISQIDLLNSVKAWAAENLNVSKGLEEGFLGVLGSMKSGLSTLFSDLMSGTKSAKDAFRDFAMSVVESIQNVIAEMMAMYIMKKILGIFDMTISGGEIVPITSMTGGAVRKAGGGEVTGNVARDSKLHMLMPGEYVLRKKAVDMIGVDTLNAMNAMGNRAMATGGHVGVANQKKGPLGQTNVYVVAPEQQPVPGPQDIIAVINDDIARNGTTKKLIKSVAMGY